MISTHVKPALPLTPSLVLMVSLNEVVIFRGEVKALVCHISDHLKRTEDLDVCFLGYMSGTRCWNSCAKDGWHKSDTQLKLRWPLGIFGLGKISSVKGMRFTWGTDTGRAGTGLRAETEALLFPCHLTSGMLCFLGSRFSVFGGHNWNRIVEKGTVVFIANTVLGRARDLFNKSLFDLQGNTKSQLSTWV